jgi:hypothetical protein
MFTWLKPGGSCFHSTGLGANNFSTLWNGHWAYSDLGWRLTHLQLAGRVGFDVLHVEAQYDHGGLPPHVLGSSLKQFGVNDLCVRGAIFILRKLQAVQH